ncbi:MAG: glutaminase A [Gammaproteobacteria bacterium]|nr:glutaminase A [Gammaproteobacteria bacterium]
MESHGQTGDEPRARRSELTSALEVIYEQYRSVGDGKVADYIPELAKADPGWFGITVATTDGELFEYGDSKQPFSIQSISKPFVYGLALEDLGRDQVLSRVGVEPSGEAFNSIILDQASMRPFNPMINTGAIVTTDMIRGRDFADRITRLLDMLSRYAGHDLHVDSAVFMSERASGHRNRAIAHLMLSFGMLSENVEETLELYFQQCAVLVTCRDLAVMGATLASGGVNPSTGVRAIGEDHVKDVLSLMLSCGMYDYSGEWAYRIGIPAKSGVGGGILAVVPGLGAIATFSPLLDQKGNSVRGIKVFEELSARYNLHFLEAVYRGNTLGRALQETPES